MLTCQRVKNPNYKGKWKTPWIDNPGIVQQIFKLALAILLQIIITADLQKKIYVEFSDFIFSYAEFEDDPDLYVLKPIKYVGIEVWQVGPQDIINLAI